MRRFVKMLERGDWGSYCMFDQHNVVQMPQNYAARKYKAIIK